MVTLKSYAIILIIVGVNIIIHYAIVFFWFWTFPEHLLNINQVHTFSSFPKIAWFNWVITVYYSCHFALLLSFKRMHKIFTVQLYSAKRCLRSNRDTRWLLCRLLWRKHHWCYKLFKNLFKLPGISDPQLAPKDVTPTI